jgi:signal transduction histidine kinase
MAEKYSVLCVDDEIENVEMMKRVLKDHYVVFGAFTGGQGLEILRQRKIHAIISDQRMPGMSGLEFLHQVRQKDSDIILIILTAYADLPMAMDAINNERIQGYFQKPVQANDLLVVLKREFKRLGLEQQNRLLLKETQSLNRELQTLNTLKSNFLRLLSHEIRTPLSTIIGAIMLIDPAAAKEFPLTSDDFAQLWTAMKSQSVLLQSLLEDVLYLMELENVNFSMPAEPVAIRPIVSETVALLQEKLQAKDLNLNEDFHNNPRVLGNIPALSRVFRNLLNNAIQFCPPGGDIQIGFKADECKLSCWVTSTRDRFHPNFHEKVFEIAGESHGANGQAIVGTGVNLAITKLLIEAQGGHVSLESTPQLGNRVSLELPLLPSQTTGA